MISEEFMKAFNNEDEFFFSFDINGDIVISSIDYRPEPELPNLRLLGYPIQLTPDEKVYAKLIDLDDIIISRILYGIEDCSFPRETK